MTTRLPGDGCGAAPWLGLVRLACLIWILSVQFAVCQPGANRVRLKAASARDYYTDENESHVLLELTGVLPSSSVEVVVSYLGQPLSTGIPPAGGTPFQIAVPLGDLPLGEHQLVCSLSVDSEIVARERAPLRLLPAKPNAVKIDRVSGTLVVQDLPFIPFGFYCRTDDDHLPKSLPAGEAIRGFNMLSAYQSNRAESRSRRRAYMDHCARLGMRVNYHLIDAATAILAGQADRDSMQALIEEVSAFRDHPALLSWYVAEEPGGHGIPPERLRVLYEIIHELDPYHPVTALFADVDDARRHATAVDVILVERYPIPHDPPAVVGATAAAFVAAFRHRKPVWSVPQVFGGNEWWPREPTPSEARVMTYAAVIGGATGIQYFLRRPPNVFPKSPVVWGACGATAVEMMELVPALASSGPAPTVLCSNSEVRVRAWRERDTVTVLAVNTKNAPVSATFTFPGLGVGDEVLAPFEGRVLSIEENSFRDMLDAHGTRAYQIAEGPVTGAGMSVHPANLVLNPSYEDNPTPGVPAGCYVSVAADGGASFFVDPRVAVHGRHSLRITVPRVRDDVRLEPFAVKLEADQAYSFSVWARARACPVGPATVEPMPPVLELVFPHVESPTEPGKLLRRQFPLSQAWEQVGIAGIAVADRRSRIAIRLLSPGTYWLDLVQAMADPAISPCGTSFAASTTVEVTTAAADAVIRYTLDGSAPGVDSPVCRQPLKLASSCLLSCAAFRDGKLLAWPVSARFTRLGTLPADAVTDLEPGLRFLAYAAPQEGWRGFPSFDLTKAEFTGVTEELRPSLAGAGDQFGLRFEGYFLATAADVYTFFLAADDGAKLWIGGALVVDNQHQRGTAPARGHAALEKGYHRIRIDYVEHVDEEFLAVTFGGSDGEMRALSGSGVLYH